MLADLPEMTAQDLAAVLAGSVALVALTRRAGGLIMGKTVTTEFANRYPGKTHHPQDPARTPGGSSGGSSSAIAARLCAVRELEGRSRGRFHAHRRDGSRRGGEHVRRQAEGSQLGRGFPQACAARTLGMLAEDDAEAEAQAQFPDLMARNAAYHWDLEPPGAEPTRAVVARVARGLQRLREEHDGQTVLLVSHGFVVRCLRYLIDGLSEAEFFAAARIPNGSYLTRQLG